MINFQGAGSTSGVPETSPLLIRSRFAPPRFAPSRFAPSRFTHPRFIPVRFEWLRSTPGPNRELSTSFHSSGKSAGVPIIPSALTPRRSALLRRAPFSRAPVRSAPFRLTCPRFASCRSAATRFAPGPTKCPLTFTHESGKPRGVPCIDPEVMPVKLQDVRFVPVRLAY